MLNEIKEIYESNFMVKFKLCNVDYIIEKYEEDIVIYQEQNPLRKNRYRSIEELFNNYLIYSEPLIENENLIQKIYK